MHKAFYFLLLLFVFPCYVFSQQLPSIADKTTGMKKHEGFIPYFIDEDNGKLYVQIDPNGKELLYVTSMPAALGSNDIGLDRGLLGATRIIKFNRVGRKLMMIQPNYDFRAVTTNTQEKKAVEQSFAQSILWGFTIVAETNGNILVDATAFLLQDGMKVSNVLAAQNQGSYRTDETRSALYFPMTKNFPLNTELETTITLVNTDGKTGANINSVTPSAEAVTFRQHHSFVQLPDDKYVPRVFDSRSSFYATSFFDYSTPVSEPIDKYFIARHRLVKKDPAAAMSEAVKPIVYYVDNGIPEPIRSALVEGAQWWNQAFEAAGFINAFQVKILPEDADPMDLRYNVINWVHRSTRGWSYGASVTDPRTGEIIKGHVSLGSLRVRQDYLIAQGLLAPFENGIPADDKMMTMALNRLKQLAAHEVGHTLGLMHNYAASVVNRSSVMDYPPPAVVLDEKGNIDLRDAYATGIGEWDKIAIDWGYRQYPDEANAKQVLTKKLGDAYKNGFQYISDRDARDEGGLHPNAHLWDAGKDPVDALELALKVRAKALDQFGPNNIRTGTPMAMLEDVLVPVYLYHRYQVEAVAKIVGGMNYTYAIKGDGQAVTRAISKAEQEKALNEMIKTLDPKVLLIPGRILSLIPPRPAGYDYHRELFKRRTGLVLDALSPAETAAALPLDLLFNSKRLNRMVEFKSMNGGLGLDDMIAMLINETWKAPRRKGVENLIQMQTEQMLLTYLLAESVDEQNSFVCRAVLQQSLKDLKTFIEGRKKEVTDKIYSGHLLMALARMEKPEEAKTTRPLQAPPGSPIGCDN